MCVCVCVFAQRFALTQHYQRVNGEDDDDDADDNEQLCLFHQFVFTRVMLYLCARANTLMYKFTHTQVTRQSPLITIEKAGQLVASLTIRLSHLFTMCFVTPDAG